MRIVKAEGDVRRVPLTVPYRIAGRSFDAAEILLVTLRDETGREGYGAGSPVAPLTGLGVEASSQILDWGILPALLGRDVSDLAAAVACAEARAGGAAAALAAVDIALHDLHAKRAGVPLAAMLGGARLRLVTSVTVGIGEPEEMAASARRHAARGFRILKVKIGEDPDADVRALELIRAAAGPEVAIRVDANQGYSPADAASVARSLARLGVELFEQPVAAGDAAGMAQVAAGTAVPVVADEAVKDASDLPPLVAARAARGVNIKLMKCGGIAAARRIDAALEEAGWASLVGCFDESVAGIAAAAHFAAASLTAAWIDLDGHLDLAEDPFTGGVEIVDGEIVLGSAPGLGVAPRV
jgi:L-alanine-DL-glutamate epimerase-like enolase superfamily enzyme